MKKYAVWIILLLSGCSTTYEIKVVKPTAEQLQNADYGRFPSDHEAIIHKFLRLRMWRPSTAKFNYKNEPEKKWAYDEPKHLFGYGLCVDISTPKRGGYYKPRSFYFLIKNESVVLFVENPSPLYCGPKEKPKATTSKPQPPGGSS